MKRIRPQGLEPIDYSKENYTTALWFCEGVTSYYGDLLLRRAGLMKRQEYLEFAVGRNPDFASRAGRKPLVGRRCEPPDVVRQICFLPRSRPEHFLLQQGPADRLAARSRGFVTRPTTSFLLDSLMRDPNDNFAKESRFFEDDFGIAGDPRSHRSQPGPAIQFLCAHRRTNSRYADLLRIAGLELNGDRVREIANPTLQASGAYWNRGCREMR